MFRCHVFLTVVLAVWPQVINTQDVPTSTTYVINSDATPTSSKNTESAAPSSTAAATTVSESSSISPITSPTSTVQSTPPSSPTSEVTSPSISSTSVPPSESTSTSTDSTTVSSTVATTSVSESSSSSTAASISPASTSPATFPSTSALPSESTSTSTDSSSTFGSTSATTAVSKPPSSSTSLTTDSSSSSVASTTSATTPSTIPTTTTVTTPSTRPTTTTPSTPPPTPVLTMDDDYPSVEWQPKSEGKVIIQVEEGFKISVTILQCKLDGENKEKVTIESDVEGEGLLFTYSVKSKPSYLFNQHVLYGYYNGGKTSKFHANFSRIGERLITTTTQITTSTQFIPTPTVWNTSTITVFVSGRDPLEYQKKEILDLFRNALKKMAIEYCFDQNFHLAENITINNAVIRQVEFCPRIWPRSRDCAKITFGIPILLMKNVNTSWSGYQLNEKHLKIMWDRYHKKYIDDDFSPFPIPNPAIWVKWEVIVFCGTTVVFLLCLLGLKHAYMKFSRGGMGDDTEQIISKHNDDYGVSLTPHPMQEYPPIFETTYQDIHPGHPVFVNTGEESDDMGAEEEEGRLSKIDLNEETLGESGA